MAKQMKGKSQGTGRGVPTKADAQADRAGTGGGYAGMPSAADLKAVRTSGGGAGGRRAGKRMSRSGY